MVALLSAATALLGLLGPQGAVAMGLLLAGAWTIAAAFILVESSERAYYAGWGIIIAGLSLSYFIPIQDALALILIAIVGLIVATAYYSRTPRVTSSAGAVAPQAGGGPTSNAS